MNWIKKNGYGLLLCVFLAIPAYYLGKILKTIGGPVIAMLIGFCIAPIIKKYDFLKPGILFTSKKILQIAVVLLGFGLNLGVVFETGKESLPIILVTISTSLVVAFLFQKIFRIVHGAKSFQYR